MYKCTIEFCLLTKMKNTLQVPKYNLTPDTCDLSCEVIQRTALDPALVDR